MCTWRWSILTRTKGTLSGSNPISRGIYFQRAVDVVCPKYNLWQHFLACLLLLKLYCTLLTVRCFLNWIFIPDRVKLVYLSLPSFFALNCLSRLKTKLYFVLYNTQYHKFTNKKHQFWIVTWLYILNFVHLNSNAFFMVVGCHLTANHLFQFWFCSSTFVTVAASVSAVYGFFSRLRLTSWESFSLSEINSDL